MQDLHSDQIIIIGSGRVGSALARVAADRGFKSVIIVSRNPAAVRGRLGSRIRVVAGVGEIPVARSLLVLAVPDDEIASVAAGVATDLPDTHEICAIHTSGMIPSSVLAPLASKGARVLSFHPVTAFPPPESDADPFDGTIVTLEGSSEARAIGRAFAKGIRAVPVDVSIEQKQVVHLAASVFANFSTTLASVAQTMLTQAALPASAIERMLADLARSVAHNMRAGSPDEALTGPIARGDADVVARHLMTLQAVAPADVRLYTMLAHMTANLAERAGRLDADAAARIRAQLDAMDLSD